MARCATAVLLSDYRCKTLQRQISMLATNFIGDIFFRLSVIWRSSHFRGDEFQAA